MRRPAIGIAAILIAAVPALTSCASGSNAETRTQGATVDGVNATVNGIVVRDAFILVPSSGVSRAGSDVQLHATVVNSAPQADRVTGVFTDLSSHITSATSTSVAGFTDNMFGDRIVTFSLDSITQDLRDGDHVPVTLHFENAGSASVLVPVVGSQPYYAPLQTSTP